MKLTVILARPNHPVISEQTATDLLPVVTEDIPADAETCDIQLNEQAAGVEADLVSLDEKYCRGDHIKDIL